MKVFISWSGKLSGDVALLLNEWLPSAVPGIVPWLSKEGIEKGSIWFGAIEEALKDTSVGVICLTRENMVRPWVLFEAGGLNKGLDKTRVCPLLLDLEDKELDPPLNQFHTTKLNKKDMLALCMMINQHNTGHVHSELQLKKFFNTFWPEFEKGFTALFKKNRASRPPKKKDPTEMLEQILETMQALLTASQSRSAFAPILPPLRYAPLDYLDYPGNLPSTVYPPSVPQPSPAQLPTGLLPGSSAAAELRAIMAEPKGKVVRPAMAQGQKPKPSAAEELAKKPPAA